MRKVLFTLIILAALSAAGIWAYQRFFGAATNAPEEKREEHVIHMGTLSAMVNATGTIPPEKQTTLSFKSLGRVAEASVTEGQAVSESAILARLETADLEYTVAQAKLALAITQVQLRRLQRPPAEQDVAGRDRLRQTMQMGSPLSRG